MLNGGIVFRRRPYVKVAGSWYLLVTIAAMMKKQKELGNVG